ncbi:MAG: hypothetical protein IPM30_12300 [Burkholderiales bacterium]|jgi:hypothetical protein|nr:hypothetical protein [Burkholderiales bacterium]
MFGRSRPVVIDSYGSRRRRGVPRWLVLLLVGVAAGVAAVVYVQERFLPPRLSAAESAQLQSSFAEADAERQRLRGELAEATKSRDATAAENKRLGDELAVSRATGERLREDVAFVAGALPPDPRGGAVEIRAARLIRSGASLAYEVALVREGGGKPIGAVMQLVVTGESPRGGETTVSLEPAATSIGAHQVLRGAVPLPEGFAPRQGTIRVLDRPGGQLLGMRVMYVR